jgi:hypothetical protein
MQPNWLSWPTVTPDSPVFPLVAIGAGKVAVKVEDHRGAELVAPLVGASNKLMHLLPLGSWIVDEHLQPGERRSFLFREGASFNSREQ